jgi:hypothetical protein
VAEVELHDELVTWMLDLDDAEWDRTVVVIDRLATLGSTARMPLSRSLGEGLFELAVHPWPDRPSDHLPVHQGRPHRPAHHLPQATPERTHRDHPSPPGR